MELSIELDREEDGRWIAEVIELPGVMRYGSTREQAIMNAERLAIEVIADRIQHGELPPAAHNIMFRVQLDAIAATDRWRGSPSELVCIPVISECSVGKAS